MEQTIGRADVSGVQNKEGACICNDSCTPAAIIQMVVPKVLLTYLPGRFQAETLTCRVELPGLEVVLHRAMCYEVKDELG